MDIFLIIFSLGFFIMMIVVSLLSKSEGETTAAKRAFFASILLPLPYLILAVTDFSGKSIIAYTLIGFTLLSALIILFPFSVRRKPSDEKISEKYDERDVIFVRNKLKPGSEEFEEYYNRKPENLEPDNAFRSAPGLLSSHSSQADPFMFASTEASFITCENLIEICDGPVSEEQITANENDISEYIKNWTKHLGAHSVGITLLKDEHKYSIAGRGENYGKPVFNNHKFAIAFTVQMDYDSIRKGPQAPAVMESAKQYLNAGT
ncbi:MAG: hypothetical protein PF518_09125, partial [Spirochaetaceae bacterium]|nr:hypothetical protein [Spirochaetaceae bacterium]